MEKTNLGKRLLYGFASSLLLGLAVPIFVADKFIAELPSWSNWLLPFFFIIAFWFGYALPSIFEKFFAQSLKISALIQASSQPGLGGAAQSVRKADLQRKMPVSLGWFFLILILVCLILLFTGFSRLVPYIFVPGFFIFMFWVAKNYNKNRQ